MINGSSNFNSFLSLLVLLLGLDIEISLYLFIS